MRDVCFYHRVFWRQTNFCVIWSALRDSSSSSAISAFSRPSAFLSLLFWSIVQSTPIGLIISLCFNRPRVNGLVNQALYNCAAVIIRSEIKVRGLLSLNSATFLFSSLSILSPALRRVLLSPIYRRAQQKQ